MSGYIDRVVQIAVHEQGEAAPPQLYVLYENGDVYRLDLLEGRKWVRITLPHEERT